MQPAKRRIFLGVGIGIVVLAVVAAAIFCVINLDTIFRRFIPEEKYIECDPEKMRAHLENIFNIDFPDTIKGFKAAKTNPSWDGGVSFIVKFTADPNSVDRFLKSIPGGLAGYFPYEAKSDLRGDPNKLTKEPEWFTEKIEKGYRGFAVFGRSQSVPTGSAKIYIDTSDEWNYKLYLEGLYESKFDY